MAKTPGANKQTEARPHEGGVVVGRIKGAWGLRGDVKVEVLTDFPGRFSPGSILTLGDQPARVQRSRSTKGGLLVKLDGVDDRTKAESLRGRFLTVPEDQVGSLPAGSYYHYQVIDMAVWSDGGEYLGDVKEIIATGGNDVYVVRSKGREDLLLPAVEDVVLEVSLQDGRMTVRLPEGLG